MNPIFTQETDGIYDSLGNDDDDDGNGYDSALYGEVDVGLERFDDDAGYLQTGGGDDEYLDVTDPNADFDDMDV